MLLLAGLLFSACGDDSVATSDAAPQDAPRQDAPPLPPTLANLTVSVGTLSPAFAPETLSYAVDLGLASQTFSVTPTATTPAAVAILVNGTNVESGTSSPPFPLALGATTVTIVLTNTLSGSAQTYALTVNRGAGILQRAYEKASNTDAMDNFASSVSLSGNTLAVGARYEDSSATGINGNQMDNSALNSGAVYVFAKNGTNWVQQAYLKASNTDAGDVFGGSVSLSGDTLAVGAHGEASNSAGIDGNQADNSAPESGAVYVFVRTGTTWTQQAYLKASNIDTTDRFGLRVSLAGDTLAVGAPAEDSDANTINGNQSDNSALDAGAVYVFDRSGTTWAQQAYLKASNADAGDNFGSSLSVFGDTIAVGAAAEDSNSTGSNGDEADNSYDAAGAAYVFVRSGTTWTQQAYLKASNSDPGDFFGSTLSLSGDTLAVGARFEDSNATGINGTQSDNSARDSGAVYVFVRSDTVWNQQAYLKASNTGAYDDFSSANAVALSGDTLAVGADVEDSNATGINGNPAENGYTDSGAAYLFVRNGTTWTQQAYLKASNTGPYDYFGNSISLSGNTLAAGALQESSNATGTDGNQADNSAVRSGAVYIFE